MSDAARNALALVDELLARGVAPNEAARTSAALIAQGAPRDQILSLPEFAAAIGRSLRTVQGWAASDSIPVVRAGETVVGVHFPTFLAACQRLPKS